MFDYVHISADITKCRRRGCTVEDSSFGIGTNLEPAVNSTSTCVPRDKTLALFTKS